MPKFLSTRGQPTLGIALCSRCQIRRKLADITDDGNAPGFKVCRPEISPGCWDQRDPMRLPPRQPDKMTLPFVRPDIELVPTPSELPDSPLYPPTRQD